MGIVSLFLLLGSPLWGELSPGPHAVGYRQIDRIDHSRPYWMPRDLDGKPRTRERGRPMHVSIWYPAKPGGTPLTFGEYVARDGARAIYQFPLMRDLTADQRARLEAMPGHAVLDAPAAAGRFPVILYSLGTTAMAHVTPEYLASHGYIVALMPRLGPSAGFPPDVPDALDIDNKVKDTDFLINVLAEVPGADLHNMGAVGFSAGGRWGLSELMKNPDVHALVSLDSVLLFDEPLTKAWMAMPWFDLDLVRAPVLHMIRKEWVPREKHELWERMKYADRWYLRFDEPGLDHFDFQSAGYAQTLAGGRADKARAVAATFDLFHRYTLAFFDAHLKGDAKARALLDKKPPAGVEMTMTKGAAPPLSLTDFLNAIEDGGVDRAIAAYRRQWKLRREPPVAEAPLNLCGYTLLGNGRTADAIKIFQLNAEAFPRSANVYDSLGDGYDAAGDRARARQATEKALGLLEKDASLNPERKKLVQKSIEDKLKRLRD